MAEFFELSFVYKQKPDPKIWKDKLALEFKKYIYSGRLDFLNDREIIFNEYSMADSWEYELSVEVTGLFSRDNILDMLQILTESVSIIMLHTRFCYAIGNVETNGSFLSSYDSTVNPSKEMVLKSSLIFVPYSKLHEMEINLYHIVLKKGGIACLFNPTSGLLFSSIDDKYKIVKDSI